VGVLSQNWLNAGLKSARDLWERAAREEASTNSQHTQLKNRTSKQPHAANRHAIGDIWRD
jgi:hypothetical protein